jgi:large subunit ribosomal protein L27e
VEVDFKALAITPEVVQNSAKRTEARKQIKKMLQERYTAGKNKWFFSKLRF